MNIYQKLETFKNSLDTFTTKNQYSILTAIVIFIGALWRVAATGSLKQFSPSEIEILNVVKVNTPMMLEQASADNYLYAFIIKTMYAMFRNETIFYRLGFVIVGIATIIVFFMFVRSWYNKQIALISTLFFATNYIFIIMSVTLNSQIFIIFLILLLLYVLSAAYRDKNIWLFVASGLIAGIGIFINPMFIIFGFIFMFMISVLFIKNRKFITSYLLELGTMLVITTGSLIGYLIINKEGLNKLLSSFIPSGIDGYYLNIGKNFMGLVSTAAGGELHNVGLEPVLDPLISTCLLCGLVYAIFHLNKKKHLFLFTWFIGGLLLVSLRQFSFINLSIIAIPCFIIAGALLDYVLTNWTRTFPYNKGAKLIMTFIFSIFIFLSVFYNYQKFFYAWQKSDTIKQSFNNTLEINK